MITFVLSVGAQGTGSGAGPTGGVDTSAANLLVAYIASSPGAPITLSDNYGNTWVALTPAANGDVQARIYACLAPSVGVGHTFQVAGAGTYPVFSVMAFSGFSGVIGPQNGATSGGSPLSPGSVTPGANDSLIIYALGSAFGDATASVDIGSITQQFGLVYGVSYAGAFAYEIQTTAAPIAPTFTFGALYPYAVAVIAVFGPSSIPDTITTGGAVREALAAPTGAILAGGAVRETLAAPTGAILAGGAVRETVVGTLNALEADGTVREALVAPPSVLGVFGAVREALISTHIPAPPVIPRQFQTLPPLQSLQKTIPSYLYVQYQDDDDLQAFVAAYNGLAQGYVNTFNQLNLPVYSGPLVAGDLLDWVAKGLYGLQRPTLALTHSTGIGAFNTYTLNSIPFNGRVTSSTSDLFPVTDDIFRRIITWSFYKGDGQVFCTTWLKRRAMRFLIGVNGLDLGVVDNTYPINMVWTGSGGVTITITTNADISAIMAKTLAAGIVSGVLPLPFQVTPTVIVI